MLALATPLDEELARLNRELAGTALGYGDARARAETARHFHPAVCAQADAHRRSARDIHALCVVACLPLDDEHVSVRSLIKDRGLRNSKRLARRQRRLSAQEHSSPHRTDAGQCKECFAGARARIDGGGAAFPRNRLTTWPTLRELQ